MKKILIVIFLIFNVSAFGQKFRFYGIIRNSQAQTIPSVTIRAAGTNYFTQSDPAGRFELKLPANRKYKIIVSAIGFASDTFDIYMNKNIKRNIIIKKSDIGLNPIYAIANSIDESGMERISTTSLSVLPDISGNGVETLIKSSMGVSSNNELTSQYNVRGGSFDENLIYVNGIQIYRPFLVRSGQQEGMSFINSDLVQSIKFSAGGFGAEYGDKMSSVLAIKYKIPKKFESSANVSLLGARAYIANISKNKKFTFLAGLRYKRSSYLFNTFEVKGDYKPIFTDFQIYTTYKFNNKFKISFLGNTASNIYSFQPSFSRSDFGSFTQRLTINVAYDGKEKDKYQTLFGALIFDYKVNNKVHLKFFSSSYYTNEAEKYDIYASYWLNEAASKSDSVHNAGDSVLNLGVGGYLTHARNYLNAMINEASFVAYKQSYKNLLQFGIKYKREQIYDILNEWKYIDSAGYSINPQHYYPQNAIYIYSSSKASNTLITNRFKMFLQDEYSFYIQSTKIKLKFGIRFSYNDYNHQALLSPRFSSLLTPKWTNAWYFRFSTGVYYQPPFYREFRKFDGSLVKNQKAQRAIHFVAGAYHSMKIWGRPFKFSSEIFYKKLDHLIPYELDNLQIRYYADEISHGYAAGVDFKLYGEFVRGTDSWISISLLKTMEDIENDYYYEYLDANGKVTYNRYQIADTLVKYPGYIPRPSDQRINIGLYFQDYVPGHQNMKVNLAYFFGTPLPFGPPERGRYLAVLRSAYPYIRGDIGFSFLLKSPLRTFPKGNILRNFKSIWMQIEIFNFMGIRNIANYDWVELVPNTSNPMPVNYETIAVPNRLTGRLFNVKLIFNL
jgi:hypothetical protein